MPTLTRASTTSCLTFQPRRPRNQNVPVPGFDPITQTWPITLASPLPAITHPVTIDGFTQANTAGRLPLPRPGQLGRAEMADRRRAHRRNVHPDTLAPLPVGTTPPIPYSATAAGSPAGVDRDSWEPATCRSPKPIPGVLAIAFQGADGEEAIPNLIAANDLTGGAGPSITIQTMTVGGVPIGNPTLISSVPNSTVAIDGNNAAGPRDHRRQPDRRGDGAGARRLPRASSADWPIEGFGVGISIPSPTDVGDLIQGNSIGEYLAYPVDSQTGVPLPSPGHGRSRRAGQHARKGSCWARPTRRWAASRPRMPM